MAFPDKLAALPNSIDSLHLIVDVAGIVLCLALAYLAYGIAHNLVDLLAKTEGGWRTFVRTVCHVVMNILLYLIAALYGIEYVLMKAAGAI